MGVYVATEVRVRFYKIIQSDPPQYLGYCKTDFRYLKRKGVNNMFTINTTLPEENLQQFYLGRTIVRVHDIYKWC